MYYPSWASWKVGYNRLKKWNSRLHFKGRDTWVKEMSRGDTNNLQQPTSADLKLQAAQWRDVAPGETFRTAYLADPAASPFRNQHWEAVALAGDLMGGTVLPCCVCVALGVGLVPHPTSRVSRLLPECGLPRPVPVSAVSVLLGPQDGNLAVHSLTCSLAPLVGSGSPVLFTSPCSLGLQSSNLFSTQLLSTLLGSQLPPRQPVPVCPWLWPMHLYSGPRVLLLF